MPPRSRFLAAAATVAVVAGGLIAFSATQASAAPS